jgi:acetyltransferase
VTNCGTKLHVTRAVPADIDILRQFYDHVSPEDLRFRFFQTMEHVDQDRLAAMVDDERAMTFLAWDADNRLVAVATLVAEPAGKDAEVALSVRADCKHQGISWTLLDHVLAAAKAQGYHMVSSLEAGANRDAIRLEREMGFVTRLTSAAPVEILASKLLS